MNDHEARRRLEEENAELKARLAKLEAAGATERKLSAVRNAGAPRLPLREWLLETLSDVGHPLYSQYVTALHVCHFDRPLAATRLGTLAADERKRIETGRAAGPMLTNGLVANTGTPIKRIWARSDWPLADRVVADTSGRVLFLKTALWVFEQATRADAKWANQAALEMLANQLARDVPIDTRALHRDFSAWSARVREELAGLEQRDLERREAAAEGLASALNERQLLLGAAGPFTVVPGTEEQSWKDANG